MPDLRWSPGALRDLDAIATYFEETSPRYAKSLVARLYAAPDILMNMPQLGRAVSEYGAEHVRELVRDSYRILYVVTDDLVEVLAVLHGRQDLGKKLGRE